MSSRVRLREMQTSRHFATHRGDASTALANGRKTSRLGGHLVIISIQSRRSLGVAGGFTDPILPASRPLGLWNCGSTLVAVPGARCGVVRIGPEPWIGTVRGAAPPPIQLLGQRHVPVSFREGCDRKRGHPRVRPES